MAKILTGLTCAGMLIGGVYFAEDRYAHAEDVNETKEELHLRIEQAKSLDELEKGELQLKITRIEIQLLEDDPDLGTRGLRELERLKRKQERLEEILGF